MHFFRGIAAAALVLAGGLSVDGQVLPVQVNGQNENKTVVAIVEYVNVLERVVTVVDTWGIATRFVLPGGAAIRSSRGTSDEFRTLYDLKPGHQVQVSYRGTPDRPDSITIIILLGRDNGGLY